MLTIISAIVIPFILTILWALFFFLIGQLNRFYYYGYRNAEIFVLLLMLILGLASLAAFIGPAIYFATKYKPSYGLWYLGIFLVSVFVLVILLFVFLSLMDSAPMYQVFWK